MNASLFKNWAGLVAAMTVFGLGGPSEAAVLTLDASSQGWFRTAGIGLSDDLSNGAPDFVANTFTGIFEDIEHRSFFTFDIGSVESPITSITVRLFTEFYFSGDPTETVTVFDVHAPGSLLTSQPPDEVALDIFEDLGTGDVYGEGVISSTPGEVQENGSVDLDGVLEITLSSAAIADFNKAQSCEEDFSVGLALSSPGGIPIVDGVPPSSAEGVRFSLRPSDPAAQLIVNVDDSGSQSPVDCNGKPPEEPESIPEPGMILGVLAAFSLGAVTLRSPQQS